MSKSRSAVKEINKSKRDVKVIKKSDYTIKVINKIYYKSIKIALFPYMHLLIHIL